jgi:hypothetical protein
VQFVHGGDSGRVESLPETRRTFIVTRRRFGA